VPAEDAEATDLRRWLSEGADIRNDAGVAENDAGVAEEVLAFVDATGARSIVMTDRIIGCPDEEGIDYEGPTCPACPFWPDAIAGLASAYTRLMRPDGTLTSTATEYLFWVKDGPLLSRACSRSKARRRIR